MSFIYDSMHPYQRSGAHFMRKSRNPLLADEPGLGKTIQALGTIVADTAQRFGPEDVFRLWHLVVCPSVAVENVWKPEIKRWLPDHHVEVLALSQPAVKDRRAALAAFTPKPETRHVFVVINPEMLRVKPVDATGMPTRHDALRYNKRAWLPENAVVPEFLQREWDTVICDESHNSLIVPGGKVSAMSQTRAGLVLVGSKARRRIALSGTPMRGKPEQLWGTLNWLRPDLYKSFWTWLKPYFVNYQGTYGWVIEGLRPDGEEKLAKDLSRLMLRRTKAEVLPDLPPKTYAGYHLIEGDSKSPLGVWLEMNKTQAKQYDQLLRDSVLFGDDGSEVVVDGTLATYTRQRQIATTEHKVVRGTLVPTAAGPKYDWLCEWLEESGGKKIVVVSQFTSVIDAFAAGLREKGYSVATLTGKTSQKRRTEMVTKFQETDEIQVFMLNTKAGGTALTLDAADYLVFLDETSIPDNQIQAEDRIHRASRNHNVTIYVLRTLGTIEEEVAFVAAARQDVQQYLLDGARGVEVARDIYLMSRDNTREGVSHDV